MEKWADRPVILIRSNDYILKQSSLLKQAITIKRKIHKIFDLMKCSNSEAFIFSSLNKYNYFALKENLFSLKDLVDINDYKMINQLKEYLSKFENHIRFECSICNYKGGKCMMCMSDETIYAYNIESVLYCNECKKLFHKKCCQFHPCIINR